jgi:hypothetical protein
LRAVAASVSGQQIQVETATVSGVEYLLAMIAALRNVMSQAGKDDAATSGHKSEVGGRGLQSHGKCVCPLFPKLCLLASISVFSVSCGWQKTMAFPSPSGKATVEVWQTRFANERGTKIELVTLNRVTELDRINRKAIIYFVHVYWSPDEKRVAVLATGYNFSRVAYDLQTNKPIPFEQVQKELGASIAVTYHVPRGEDPIQWAALADAGVAFSKHHPEINLSYR